MRAALGRVGGGWGIAVREVPAGTYALGWTPGQGDACEADERPAHPVTLTRAVMGSNPSDFTSCGEACLVVRVSWFRAVAFANALSARDGLELCYVVAGDEVTWPKGAACRGWRLPMEAEWGVQDRPLTLDPWLPCPGARPRPPGAPAAGAGGVQDAERAARRHGPRPPAGRPAGERGDRQRRPAEPVTFRQPPPAMEPRCAAACPARPRC